MQRFFPNTSIPALNRKGFTIADAPIALLLLLIGFALRQVLIVLLALLAPAGSSRVAIRCHATVAGALARGA